MQRVDDDAGGEVARLRKRVARDVGRGIFVHHREPVGVVGLGRGGVVELHVDPDFSVPRLADRRREGRVVERGWTHPVRLVDQALFLGGGEDRHREALRRRDRDHVGLELHRLQHQRSRVERAGVEGYDLRLTAVALDPAGRARAGPFADVRDVRREADEALDVGIHLGEGHQRLGVADARAGVGRHVVLLEIAVARHADAGHHHHVRLLVLPLVGAAVDKAHVADEGDDLLVIDQLGGGLRRLLGVPAVVEHVVFDRPPVDAAVGVHAVEIGFCGEAGEAEIVGSGDRDDAAERNGLARGGLAVGETAFQIGREGRRADDGRRSADREPQERSFPLHEHFPPSIFFWRVVRRTEAHRQKDCPSGRPVSRKTQLPAPSLSGRAAASRAKRGRQKYV